MIVQNIEEQLLLVCVIMIEQSLRRATGDGDIRH